MFLAMLIQPNSEIGRAGLRSAPRESDRGVPTQTEEEKVNIWHVNDN